MFDGRRIAEAKALCARCPAFDECRAVVDANPELWEYGVMAGVSAEERANPRTEIIDCATCGDSVVYGGKGRRPLYCGQRCASRAARQRKRKRSAA